MMRARNFSFRTTVATLFFYLAVNILAPVKAEAINVGGLIGSVIGSSMQQSAMVKFLNHYDNEGRQELFEAFKENFDTKEDAELNIMLGNVVERLSVEIAKKEISIIERPYNYFIAPDKNFNAACSLGHNIFVNSGVFTFVNNNEDQLAAVVAHEMVHGQMDHNVKGIKKQMSTIFARNVIGSQIDSYGGGLLLDIATLHVVNTGITKPNEWQADNLSYAYLTDAGYNPGAPAAVWQRITDDVDMNQGGRNVLKSILNPATHPSSKDRRTNFSQKLTEHSKNVVVVDVETGEIKVNGQTFMTPADIEGKSGKERAYMIAGSLASLYHTGRPLGEAVAQNDTVLVDEKLIVKVEENDKSAQELAQVLNSIK